MGLLGGVKCVFCSCFLSFLHVFYTRGREIESSGLVVGIWEEVEVVNVIIREPPYLLSI